MTTGTGAPSSLVRGRDAVTATVPAMVRSVVEARPTAPALVAGDDTVTYGELWEAAERWSGLLQDRGVEPGAIVAIIAPRSAALVAAALGVLVRGGVYAIVDPAWPALRRRQLLARMRPHAVVGGSPDDPALRELGIDPLPLHHPRSLPPVVAAPRERAPGDPACLLWTSGSTGPPKAVLSTHRATTRLFGPGSPLPLGPGRALPSLAAVAWDGFALEVWSQLCSGGRVLLHDAAYFMPHDLLAMTQQGATDLFLTAGLFDIFVAEDIDCFAGLETVWVGGDRLSPSHALRLLERHESLRLLNIYGPAECGVFVTLHDVERHRSGTGALPVGRPAPSTTVAVVDGGRVVPRGRSGEIWVSGDAVAAGYLDDEEGTRAAFVEGGVLEGPSEERWYRTGDLGVLDDDGVLHFLGRSDRQLKIGGHRIEPAEIEEAARAVGCIHACVVPRSHGGAVVGVAMLIVADGPCDVDDLRRRLAEVLLPQAVPWPVVAVKALPLDANGKVDRSAAAALLLNDPAPRSLSER